jgi:hypothetical protein
MWVPWGRLLNGRRRLPTGLVMDRFVMDRLVVARLLLDALVTDGLVTDLAELVG